MDVERDVAAVQSGPQLVPCWPEPKIRTPKARLKMWAMVLGELPGQMPTKKAYVILETSHGNDEIPSECPLLSETYIICGDHSPEPMGHSKWMGQSDFQGNQATRARLV